MFLLLSNPVSLSLSSPFYDTLQSLRSNHAVPIYMTHCEIFCFTSVVKELTSWNGDHLAVNRQ